MYVTIICSIITFTFSAALSGCGSRTTLSGDTQTDARTDEGHADGGDGRDYLPLPETWIATIGSEHGDYAVSVIESRDENLIIIGNTTSFHDGLWSDIWIAKVTMQGGILWQKTLGGGSEDIAKTVTENSRREIVVAAQSYSFSDADSGILAAKLDGAGELKWQKILTGHGDCWPVEIVAVGDGGFFIAGNCRWSEGGPYMDDITIVKLDENGDIVWQKRFGGRERDQANAAIKSSDGGFIVAGWTKSFGAGSLDMWILKFDSDGEAVWQKTIGGSSGDSAEAVIEYHDGGIIAAGHADESGFGGRDIQVVKLESSGELAWKKIIGGESNDEALSLCETRDGGIVIAGATTSFGIGGDMLLIGLDRGGSILWQKTIGNHDSDDARRIIEGSDGTLIAVGYTFSFGAGSYDMWVIKSLGSGDITGGCSLLKDAAASSLDSDSVVQTSDGEVLDEPFSSAGISVIENSTSFIPSFLCPE